METFSSEIGKKMRSAVKAKLIELGTEGSTGYVDEELPDYVMIMVANKKTQKQMTTDLALFLGNKTELFVTWLHEVLQKLQEVTVPAPVAKKRKSNQKEENTSKKDKKSSKKDKKSTKKPEQTSNEKSTIAAESHGSTTATAKSSAPSIPLLPSGSIRDVFAEDLLEKAKHNFADAADAATHIRKAKGKTTKESTNEFDIPTITEISTSTSKSAAAMGGGSRAKDLAELAEIQKKIYAAKKHLKELGELKYAESEDEDLLKLRDDGSNDSLNDANNADNAYNEKQQNNSKAKSPIVFEKEKETRDARSRTPHRSSRTHSPQPLSSAAVRATTSRTSATEQRTNTQQQQQHHGPKELPSQQRARDKERRDNSPNEQRSRDRERRDNSPYNKRPVHERLGAKPQSNERRPVRREKELYVPAHRRQETRGNERERWRSRERDDRRTERDEPRRNEREERRNERNERVDERRNEREKPIERNVRLNIRDSPKSDEEKSHSPQLQASTRQRVGSQVIKAPAKIIESSDDELMNDKPVNSVIKIKPRPPVSPSRQACKNLLLRAVAEAQRSTILSQNKVTPSETKLTNVNINANANSKVKARLGRTVNTENEEFFTKDLRERRLKRSASSGNGGGGSGGVSSSLLFKRQTENFIIEVEGNIKSKRRRRNSDDSIYSNDDEPYKPEPVTERLGTALSVSYKAQNTEEIYNSDEDIVDDYNSDEMVDEIALEKTQFVVTLNEEKAAQKLKRAANKLHRSRSPSSQPQVSSSSSIARTNSNEPTSTTQFDRSRSRETRRSDIRSRLAKRPATPLSPSRAARLRERESANSSPSSTNTPPRHHQQQQQQRRRGGSYVESYRKTKDVKKIIIKNDTDDEVSEASPQKQTPEKERKRLRSLSREQSFEEIERRSTTPLLPPATKKITKSSSSDRDRERERATTTSTTTTNANTNINTTPSKSKHIPIKFDLDHRNEKNQRSRSKSREREREQSLEHRDNGSEERRKISIRTEINNKYDNIPALSSVALDSAVMRVMKPKERCKYHPNCTKQFCDYYHPTATCKAFPNCKYADKCMYSHPNCKYDMACTNLDCNFSHSGLRNPSQLQTTAPPLSSHVVPVQNYKTISVTAGASMAMCKYYPNCTKVGCTFYHPKPCKFGKNCINKLECNFYHHELQSKFKWVASTT